jgi:hypothetical protein
MKFHVATLREHVSKDQPSLPTFTHNTFRISLSGPRVLLILFLCNVLSTSVGEVAITKFCFNKLGLNVIAEIPAPGKLEGGDFFPFGEELCMIGMGLRTNMYAIQYCLDNDLFGTKRVAVVKDPFDWYVFNATHCIFTCALHAPQCAPPMLCVCVCMCVE